jgi:uncharacterized membrane protein
MLRLNIKAIPTTWFLLFIIVIFLGIYFRITNIETKVYWVDEVATSIRVSGYTKQEFTQNLASLKFISVKDLQKYQKLTV